MADVDAALEQLLVEVGASVHVPDASLWPGVRSELLAHPETTGHRARVRPLVLAAAIVVLVLLAIVTIAPARRAVADFLGIGSTTVVRVDRAPADDLPGPRDDLPTSTDVRELRAELARADLQLPPASVVGRPVAWRVDPKGETVVAFADVVFAQRPDVGLPAVKEVSPGSRVEFTTVDGAPALWIEGPHTRTVDGRTRSSASALVWVVDGTELRVEGDLDRASLRRVASSVAPVHR
jgi:hypothetical protein